MRKVVQRFRVVHAQFCCLFVSCFVVVVVFYLRREPHILTDRMLDCSWLANRHIIFLQTQSTLASLHKILCPEIYQALNPRGWRPRYVPVAPEVPRCWATGAANQSSLVLNMKYGVCLRRPLGRALICVCRSCVPFRGLCLARLSMTRHVDAAV